MNPLIGVMPALGAPFGVLLYFWWDRHPRPRTLAEILERARWELDRNPSITSYTMVDGREVRTAVEPWLSFRRAVRQLGQAFIVIEPVFRSFGEALQRAMAGLPEPPEDHIGGFPLGTPSRSAGDEPEPEHVVTRWNDGWYVCEVCGRTGGPNWAIRHQFPRST